MQLSKETRKDPSMTGRMRRKFVESLIRVFTRPAASVNVEEATEIRNGRLEQIIEKYLRQGYTAGQIHAALVLKQYKTPFKPIVDEDALSNIIVNAKITLEDMLNGAYQPDKSIIIVLSTRLMYAFNQGIVDFSRQYGITNFRFLAAAGCSDECDIENGAVYPLANILVGLSPPLHEGCLCILIPVLPVR